MSALDFLIFYSWVTSVLTEEVVTMEAAMEAAVGCNMAHGVFDSVDITTSATTPAADSAGGSCSVEEEDDDEVK